MNVLNQWFYWKHNFGCISVYEKIKRLPLPHIPNMKGGGLSFKEKVTDKTAKEKGFVWGYDNSKSDDMLTDFLLRGKNN